MRWNDDDEDFDASDFDFDSPDEQAMEEIRREDERIRNMPLMKKAIVILEITEDLVEILPDDDMSHHYQRIMIEDAMSLAPKIAGAEGADLYTLRMENAVAIKVAARNLITQCSGLSMMGLCEDRYLQLLRDEVEEFRYLFVSWIRSFDKSRDIPDNWGLFND